MSCQLVCVCVYLCSCACQACAEMLQENTNLQSLNIESNFITSDGMMAVIKAMASNATLVELKIDNQVRKNAREAVRRYSIVVSMSASQF